MTGSRAGRISHTILRTLHLCFLSALLLRLFLYRIVFLDCFYQIIDIDCSAGKYSSKIMFLEKILLLLRERGTVPNLGQFPIQFRLWSYAVAVDH